MPARCGFPPECYLQREEICALPYGVLEASTAREEFGKSRCKEFLESHHSLAPAEFADELLSRVAAFTALSPDARKKTTSPSSISSSYAHALPLQGRK